MAPTVGIVVPAYRPDADQLVRYLHALADEVRPTELHVELDGGSEALRSSLEAGPATVHAVAHRRGKGAAITAGFEHLTTDILVFTDADGSTPPEEIATVIDVVRTGEADIAVGSRRHPDSVVNVHQSRLRRRLGDIFVRVAARLLPVHLSDYQCGAKAFSRESWDLVRHNITQEGFAWDIEVLTLAALADRRIVEVPITWKDQEGSTVPLIGTSVALASALLQGWHHRRCAAGSRTHTRINEWLRSPRPLLADQEFDRNESTTEQP